MEAANVSSVPALYELVSEGRYKQASYDDSVVLD